MNYFRRIEKSVNDLKYKMQIASSILKVNQNKSDIKSIKNNISEKTDDNEKDIDRINTTILNIDKALSSINDFKNDTQNNIQKRNSNILNQRTNYAIDNIYLFNLDMINEINFKMM